MPIYPHKCAGCKHEEDFVLSYVAADLGRMCPKCGRQMKRVFTTEVGFYVPPWMRAPGAKGSSANSTDRQAIYLQSDKHRKDMEARERDQERVIRMRRAKDDLNDRLHAIPKNLPKL